MPGSWSDFLKLRSGPAPPPSSEAGTVRVYADSGGALRSVQSDGTDAAIGGGGGSMPARNVGQVELDYNGPSTVADLNTPVPLTYSDGDDGMVDLTSSSSPLIVAPGVYAFSAVCSAVAEELELRLLIDDNYYSINAYSGRFNNPAANAGVCAVWFCDEADPFALYVRGETGGDPVTVGVRLLIQRIA